MVMDINKEIDFLRDYFAEFRVISDENCAYVSLKLPDKWQLPEEETMKKEFKCTVSESENEEGIVYIFGEIKNIQDIFDGSKYIIQMNKTLQEKIRLFNEKISELQNIFESKSLEELKGLNFDYGKKIIPTLKPKRGKVNIPITKPEETSCAEPYREEKPTQNVAEGETDAVLKGDEAKDTSENDLMVTAKEMTE